MSNDDLDPTLSELEDTLRRDCIETTLRYYKQLPRAVRPTREWPTLSATVEQGAVVNASIGHQAQHPDYALVTFNTALISHLYQTISENGEALLIAVLPDDLIDWDPDALLTTIYDLALAFVELHELFHLLSGHLSFRTAEYGLQDLSEVSPGFGGNRTSKIPENEAYYLEFEADAHALATLISEVVHTDLLVHVASVGAVSNNDVINHLAGQPRVFAFRIVFVSLWIAIVMIESARLDSPEHPNPSARLLSLVSTLMAWFAALGELVANPEGGKSQQLSDTDAEAIHLFLDDIAKPLFIALWEFPDGDTSSRLGLNSTSDPGRWLYELKALITGQPLTTPGGEQLQRVEAIREQMESRLAPYRMFEPKA